MSYTLICHKYECKNQALFTCGQCCFKLFCSIECQKDNWNNIHYKECQKSQKFDLINLRIDTKWNNFSNVLTSTQNDGLIDKAERKNIIWRIYNYESIEILGEGGFGIAIKIEKKENVGKNMTRTNYPKYLVLKVIKRKDNQQIDIQNKKILFESNMLEYIRTRYCKDILRYYGFWSIPISPNSTKNIYVIATEFIGGNELYNIDSSFVDGRKGNFFLDIALRLMKQLDCLHTYGIVHRDIKPDNIIISYDTTSKTMRVVLLDYGLSCLGKTDKKYKYTFEEEDKEPKKCSKSFPGVGTRGYIAPELYGIDTIGSLDLKKADIWSLGITLIYLTLTQNERDKKFPGKLTHPSYNRIYVEQDWSWVYSKFKYQRKFSKVIKKMLTIKPEERISLKESIKELKDIKKEFPFIFGEK